MSQIRTTNGKRLAGLLVAAGLSVALVAGCGSSSKGASAKPSASKTPSGKSETTSGSGGSTGASGELNRYCSAIKKSNVQALMKADVGAVSTAPGECTWADDQVQVDLYNDPDKKYYNAGVDPSAAHPLKGNWDEAIWSQPAAGMDAPGVDVRKGTLTCSVATPPNISATNLPYTGKDPLTKVADADAAAYAQKEAQLCVDAFTAAG